jgi:hypothetical protein
MPWGDYNPDEARDEHGRWTAGGGGGGESLDSSASEARSQEIRSIADNVATDLGFDRTRIDMVRGTRGFEVNGVKHIAGGDADISHGEEGRIRIYVDHVLPENAAGLIAHEIEHEKFQGALDAYRREYDAVMKDPGPAPDPNSETHWGKRGGSDAIMKPDGSLREPYDKKYPNYTAMHEALNAHGFEKFRAGDGVSAYSAEYWKGTYPGGSIGPQLAEHETLAEMASAKYTTGKFPEHYGFSDNPRERNQTRLDAKLSWEKTDKGYAWTTTVAKSPNAAEGTRLWRNLYRTVDVVYKRRLK